MSRYIYSPVNLLLPLPLWLTLVARKGAPRLRVPGRGHGCEPGQGEVTERGPGSQLPLSGRHSVERGCWRGTAVLGGCASPLHHLLSPRQKIGCKGELAHTCLQLKPEERMLEVTRTQLLSNIGCK